MERGFGFAFRWGGFSSPEGIGAAVELLRGLGWEVETWERLSDIPEWNVVSRVMAGRMPAASRVDAEAAMLRFVRYTRPLVNEAIGDDNERRWILRIYSPSARLPWTFAPTQNAVVLA